MPRYPRRRYHRRKSVQRITETELLTALERHGFMEVRDGQDQVTPYPREDLSGQAAKGGSTTEVLIV